MSHRLQVSLSAFALLCAGATSVAAQGLTVAAKPAAKPAPASTNAVPPLRTPDGTPDLQGYWTNTTVTPLERPKDLADKAFFTPEEAAAYAKRQLAIPEGRQARAPTPTCTTTWPSLVWKKLKTRLPPTFARR